MSLTKMLSMKVAAVFHFSEDCLEFHFSQEKLTIKEYKQQRDCFLVAQIIFKE